MPPNYSVKIDKALIFLACASCVVVVLGTLGFYGYEPDHGWLTAFYRSVQLFSLESGVVDEPPTPVLVEVARWIALATLLGVVYATAKALLRHFRSALRIAAMRKHTIICGAGRRGLEIARAFRRISTHGVVVVEIDEDNANSGELHNMGVEIVFGNALDSAVLRKAGVGRASALVAVTGNDEKNLAICSEVERKLNADCVLSAGVESLAWRSYFLDRLPSDSKIRIDSYLNRAARNLLLEVALDAAGDPSLRPRGVRLLIEADGPFRQELIRAAAVALQISGETKPVIHLTGTTDEEEAAFTDRFPAAALVVDLQWHRGRASTVFPEGAAAAPDFAIFALSSDSAGLDAADRFLLHHNLSPSRVYACLSSETEMLETGSMRNRPNDFDVRNLFSLSLGKFDPLEAEIEQAAIKCHHTYWESERAKNSAYDALPKEWSKLSQRYRESNRLAAMHHEVKKRIWTTLEPGGELALLTHLSRCEHMRWMAEKAMDGWRWSGSDNPSSRDDRKLKHHLLVAYDALTSPEVDKDYNAFLWALNLSPQLQKKLGLVAEDSPHAGGGSPR